MRLRVRDRFAERAFGRHAGANFIKPCLERRRDRHRLLVADLQYLIQAEALAGLFTPFASLFDVPLDGVQRPDEVADDGARQCPPRGRLADFLRRHVIDLPGDFRTSRNLRRWPPRITRDHEKVEIQRRADGAVTNVRRPSF